MAGIKDVAREAGVSASTVSYVLSGKRSISAKTTGKVMAAVEKLGYTPDASARKMRGMRNQIIALSAPIRGDINQARYNAYFLRTAWAARNAGYDVMLLTGPDAVKDIRRVTQSNLADGIVLLDVEQDDERAAQSGTFSKPCVAIGYPSSHAGCACVDIDFALMGRKAVDFLYEKGHRTVVFLRNNESDYNRHSGYVVIFRESLLAHTKELGMTVIESEHYEADSFDAQHFVSTVFAHPDRPTAIINQANASVLSQALMALHDAGMSIPQAFRSCRAARISKASDALPHHRNAGHAGGAVRRSHEPVGLRHRGAHRHQRFRGTHRTRAEATQIRCGSGVRRNNIDFPAITGRQSGRTESQGNIISYG